MSRNVSNYYQRCRTSQKSEDIKMDTCANWRCVYVCVCVHASGCSTVTCNEQRCRTQCVQHRPTNYCQLIQFKYGCPSLTWQLLLTILLLSGDHVELTKPVHRSLRFRMLTLVTWCNRRFRPSGADVFPRWLASVKFVSGTTSLTCTITQSHPVQGQQSVSVPDTQNSAVALHVPFRFSPLSHWP